MGLFSSKKKYTVNVTIQPVFEEKQIPNSAANGLIRGILEEDQLVENMLESVAGSIGINSANGYNYLKSVGYPPGFPGADVKTVKTAEQEVYAAIEANIGEPITPEYYIMGPLNSSHFGWQYCHDAMGYNSQTNELTGVSPQYGYPVYLTDIQATYMQEDYDWMVESHDMGMLVQLGPSPTSGYRPDAPFNTLMGIGKYASPTPYEVSMVATEDYVTITYIYENDQKVFFQHGITVSMGNVDPEADFHMCRYRTASGRTGFFTYQQGSGTYPLIDRAFEFGNIGTGQYYPWTYFRHGGRNAYDQETPLTMEKMKKWCDMIGVTYDTVSDAVHEDPDVSDVEQTILMFGANPADKHPACLEYLYKHFNSLYSNSVGESAFANGLAGKLDTYTTSPSQVQHIADNRFAMSFQYSGIDKKRMGGKIGKKGEYTSEYKLVEQKAHRYNTQTRSGVGWEEVVITVPTWIYRYQVLDSMYEELHVYNMRVNYEVHRKKGFAAGADSEDLLIPVDMSIMRTLGVPDQEQALCRFMRLMVNTVIVTKTRWYQSGWFKIVLIVIAIVITIWTWGAAWQSIVAAAAISATAVAITVLSIIIKGLLVSVVYKLFVKALGPKLAFLAAIAAIAASLYGMQVEADWATPLLQSGAGLAQESFTQDAADLQNEIDSLTGDIVGFQTWAQQEMDKLMDIQDQTGLLMDLSEVGGVQSSKLIPMIVLGETPTQMYDRTVASGNIGVAALSIPEFYVDTMLQLPKLKNVEEDFNDGRIGTA
jgi:hypothetical protein